MSIKYRRKPENEEMMAVYEFFRKYKNQLIFGLAAIALIIISVSYYNSNKINNRQAAAEKLFEIQKAFQNSDFDSVISKGMEYTDKYSGLDPAGDILILMAKSYMKKNNSEEALKILEKNAGITKNETFIFAVNNILGGLYMDKWLKEKDPKLAEKAGDYYMKAAYADRELHRDRTLYYAGNSYVQAGNQSKAKKALKPLYENSKALEYKLREQVKYLYEHLD